MRRAAVELVSNVLMGRHDVPPDRIPGWRAVTSNPGIARHGAERIVEALEAEGMLARCVCPVGFGQTADPKCSIHRTAPS